MSDGYLDREILRYGNKGFEVTNRRTLKNGIRLFLTRDRRFKLFTGYDGIYIYYVSGDCSLDAMKECFKDYQRFYDDYGFDQHDRGYLLYKGKFDEALFKEMRRVLVREELRRSIKPQKVDQTSESIPVESNSPAEPLTQKVIDSKIPEVSKRLFIVHGHDRTAALDIARFIEKRYPIDAILLEEQANRGRTLIEKLEDNSDVNFAIITLTPDDVGTLKGGSLKQRGRQNVIFEWGQFIGKIGRKRVCLLITGDVEIPSDLQGICYYRYITNAKECFIDLESELKGANLI